MRRAAALLLGLAVWGACAMGAAQPPRRLVTVATEGSPWGDGLAAFVKEVATATRGRLKIALLLGGVAGDEVDTASLCARGQAFMWVGSAGGFAHVVPELNALELPFLFDDTGEVDAAFSGPAFALLARAFERKGLVLLPKVSEVGWRSFAGPRPLRTRADFEGVRARAQENPIHLEMWRLLGAKPRAISVLETYQALQGGIVQVFDQSPIYMFAVSWYQQAHSYTLSRHIYQPGLGVVCKGALTSLSAEDRRSLLGIGGFWLKKTIADIRVAEVEMLARLRSQGLELVELSAAERAGLRAATRPTFQTFRAGTTPLGRELLDALEQAIEAHRRGKR